MQEQAGNLSIGQLASASGLPVKTIRFYSDSGLLPAHRTAAGHRRYAPADLARLQLIRSLRSLDVNLATITELLADNIAYTTFCAGTRQPFRCAYGPCNGRQPSRARPPTPLPTAP
ncbi:MAG: hypothetical protein DLM58_08720 [Pseudonocardiales bacterium]|nr:MAG: hypothetical protein DLM58_08720 [Pseudonocardiales bacterium]